MPDKKIPLAKAYQEQKSKVWVLGVAFSILFFLLVGTLMTWENRTGPGSGIQTPQGATGSMCANVPAPYNKIFSAAAKQYGVEPAFLAAIFYAGEHANSWPNASGPWASSPVGASGPFQFMGCTWAGGKHPSCNIKTWRWNGSSFESNPSVIKSYGGHGTDGDGDGIADVQNLTDASYSAAKFIASIGGNSSDVNKLRGVAGFYNGGNGWEGKRESQNYVQRVMAAYQSFNCAPAVAGGTTGKWIWPVDGGRISSTFGSTGPSHPRPHTGLDVAIGRGTPIKAADGGSVTTVNLNAGNKCGVYVTIDHSGGLQSVYCHMVEGSPTVSVGQHVSQGQVIGQVNNTGHSTGNHLHFGAKLNGRFVDPMNYLPAR